MMMLCRSALLVVGLCIATQGMKATQETKPDETNAAQHHDASDTDKAKTAKTKSPLPLKHAIVIMVIRYP